MSQIIRLSQATGAQLRQAAHHARLIDTPNMPFGFGNAYYAAVPSPMQEQILRKGLQSAGINYLKIEELATPASEADRFPRELQEALKQLIKAAKACTQFELQVDVRVAGGVLYATIMDDPGTNSLAWARSTVKGKGFEYQSPKTWMKVVRMKRKSFVATVEAADTGLKLCVFKGA